MQSQNEYCSPSNRNKWNTEWKFRWNQIPRTGKWEEKWKAESNFCFASRFCRSMMRAVLVDHSCSTLSIMLHSSGKIPWFLIHRMYKCFISCHKPEWYFTCVMYQTEIKKNKHDHAVVGDSIHLSSLLFHAWRLSQDLYISDKQTWINIAYHVESTPRHLTFRFDFPFRLFFFPFLFFFSSSAFFFSSFPFSFLSSIHRLSPWIESTRSLFLHFLLFETK